MARAIVLFEAMTIVHPRMFVLFAGSMLVASLCHAQVCTPVEAVFMRMNYRGRSLRETEKVLVAITTARVIRTDVTSKGGSWFVDLADVAGVGSIPVQQVQAVENPAVKPDVPGWQFSLDSRAIAVTSEAVDGRRRCVARLLFDAAPWWRLRVSALPDGIEIPVSCGEPCRKDATTGFSITNFPTRPAPAIERLDLTVYPQTPCSYSIAISPAEMLPKTVSSKEIVDWLLRSPCDIDERRARAIKVPSEIRISSEQ
jgi:hypothetical protein